MKIYVTKYALTKGVEEMEAEQCDPDTVRVEGATCNIYFRRQDWHLDLFSAQGRANGMVHAKIASLKKQIEKLEGMEF